MKILYVTTISNTVNAFLIPHIKMLIQEEHQVDVAFNIVQEVNPEIIQMGCKIHQIPLQRSPLNISNYKTTKLLKNIIISEGYDIVHTHTPVASVIVRLACRKLKNVKVFYTAHGFHFYKGAPISSWLLYYPLEKWLSRYTDTLITINKEDYSRAKRNFKAKKIEYIPGIGINLKSFQLVEADEKFIRTELSLPKDTIILLSVGEINKNKNHEVVINAMSRMKDSNIHYVICGEGQLTTYLRNLSVRLEIEKQVHLLGFRKDIAKICKSSDIFVFPSIREGLGLAAIEAMACGLPLITSNVHGIVDYSIDGITGFARSPKDIYGIISSIRSLSENTQLLHKIGEYNLTAVDKYAIENVLEKMRIIYNFGGCNNESNSVNNCTSL